MANSSPFDGSGWPATLTPTGDEPHGNANQEIFDLRKGVKLRLDHEHLAFAGSSVGGWHIQGSAVAFYQDGPPGTRADPDTTAFDVTDEGRLWVDSNDSNKLWVYEHDGTAFQKVAAHVDGTTLSLSSRVAQVAALGVDTAQLKGGAVTLAKLAAGFCQCYIGTYTGSGGVSKTITGVGFEPDFILFSEEDISGFSLSFKRQGDPSDITPSHVSGNIGSNQSATCRFDPDGFFFVKSDNLYNQLDKVFSFIAIRITT